MPRRNYKARRRDRRRRLPAIETPSLTTEEMARSLVERGLADPMVLGISYRDRRQKPNRYQETNHDQP